MKTVSNVYLIGFVITICIAVSSVRASSSLHTKPRTTRGFKTAALSTARGFGKRDGLYSNGETINDLLDDTRRGAFIGDLLNDPQDSDSFPVDWFVEELVRNPRLARLMVKKFIDQNQDGELTGEELFRNGGY